MAVSPALVASAGDELRALARHSHWCRVPLENPNRNGRTAVRGATEGDSVGVADFFGPYREHAAAGSGEHQRPAAIDAHDADHGMNAEQLLSRPAKRGGPLPMILEEVERVGADAGPCARLAGAGIAVASALARMRAHAPG